MEHQDSYLGVKLHQLAWATALLPFITTHTSFLWAASLGYVDWCVPYWDGCTSISATGRELPVKIWFKFLMTPSILLTMTLWWCATAWRVQCGTTLYTRSLRAMPVLGTLAAVSLLLYTLALGEGDAYRLVRRAGVVTSFALTYISQLLLTRLIGELARQRRDPVMLRWYQRLFALSSILLGTGILSVVLDGIMGPAFDEIEHSFEWMMALLINGYFACLALAWRGEGYVLGLKPFRR